jgi:hypothetical protein
MSTTLREVLAGLIVVGGLILAGAAPSLASVPPGPGGNGTPAICVPVPGANVTTPAGGPLIGFVNGPPAYLGQAYEHISCAPGS